MDGQVKGDLRIDGSGTASGGLYDTIKINGSGKITGDVTCRVFRINGSGHVQGSLVADDGRINGSATIDGHVKSRQMKISGSGQIKGGISGENLIIAGSATVGENLDVQQVKIEGSVKINGNCNAETFQSDGAFEINGLLNSDEITIRLYHAKSRAKEIGGGKITVMVGPMAGFTVLKAIMTLGLNYSVLEAESIEGDEITLENTLAKVVRGNQVSIGRGCEIGLVEYKGTLQKSGDAKVGEERKI